MGPSPPASHASALIRLWFGFSERVGRRVYLWTGFGLMAVKYLSDAALVLWLEGHLWTPLEYLSPLWTQRFAHVGVSVLFPLAAWSLPFVWICLSMTARRAIDAGLSPLVALLIFIPGVNYLVMLTLCIEPAELRAAAGQRPSTPPALDAALARAVVLPPVLGLTAVLVALRAEIDGTYAYGLFFGAPFAIGMLSAFLYDRRHRHALQVSAGVVQLAILVTGGFLLLAGLEGAICIAMAWPLAAGMAFVGGLLGREMAGVRHLARSPLALALVLAPALNVVDRALPEPPLREVVTALEIDAPREAIWPHLVSFSELPAPSRWLFRAGIAYPVRARIEGHGVGAVRYCEFSTGAFVEPITRWDEPERLAFDVVAQPPTMEEWSPYRGIQPPHVTAALRSRRGEFRLVELPGGRTRLEGSTWYRIDMYPNLYWSLWSDALIHGIHRRVLEHIRRHAEAAVTADDRGQR